MLWTEAETKALIKWVNFYGTDYEQIAKRIKTKSLHQIKCKIYRHAGLPASTGETLFPNLRLSRFNKQWTTHEDRAFWRVIEKHGVNEKELQKAIPNRSPHSIRVKVRNWYERIKAFPKYERAHLLKKLWCPRKVVWKDEDL